MRLSLATQNRRLIWLLCFATILVWALLRMVVQHMHLQERRERLAEVQSHLVAAQREEGRLQQQLLYAQSSEAWEERLHANKYVHPGEELYLPAP